VQGRLITIPTVVQEIHLQDCSLLKAIVQEVMSHHLPEVAITAAMTTAAAEVILHQHPAVRLHQVAAKYQVQQETIDILLKN